jgi:hypothetical protein
MKEGVGGAKFFELPFYSIPSSALIIKVVLQVVIKTKAK